MLAKTSKEKISLHKAGGTGEKPAGTILPPPLTVSPINIVFKGCGDVKASMQLHVYCALSAARVTRQFRSR